MQKIKVFVRGITLTLDYEDEGGLWKIYTSVPLAPTRGEIEATLEVSGDEVRYTLKERGRVLNTEGHLNAQMFQEVGAEQKISQRVDAET